MMKTLETQKIFEKIFKAVKPNPKKCLNVYEGRKHKEESRMLQDSPPVK